VVYLQPFRRNLLLKCASHPENAKTLLNPFILGVEGRLRLSMLILLKSSTPVLVMESSMSMPICNRFQAIRANGDEIRTS